MTEAVFDPRFEEIEVAVRYTPGTDGAAIDLEFPGLPLDIADDFFRYLGTDEGVAGLTETILAAFVGGGAITPEQALGILLS